MITSTLATNTIETASPQTEKLLENWLKYDGQPVVNTYLVLDSNKMAVNMDSKVPPFIDMEINTVLIAPEVPSLICAVGLFLVLVGYTLNGFHRRASPSTTQVAIDFFWKHIATVDVFICIMATFKVAVQYLFNSAVPWGVECVPVPGTASHVLSVVAWMLFILVILRSNGAISVLHTRPSISLLTDINRGVAILNLFLIFTIPLIVILLPSALQRSYSVLYGQICVPMWGVQPPDTDYMLFAWLVSLFMSMYRHFDDIKNLHMWKAVLLEVITHFLPLFLFHMWVKSVLQVAYLQDFLPVVMVGTVTFSSICTLCTLPLFRSSMAIDLEEGHNGYGIHFNENGQNVNQV